MRVSDWLRPMLRTWGQQRRRILTGRRQFREGAAHIDGHPSRSALAGLFEGGSSGKVEQHFAEVYTGDGLEVWRAMQGAAFGVRQILEFHYVVPGIASEKAEALGVGVDAYYARLREGEARLAERITAPSDATACSVTGTKALDEVH